MSDKPETTEGLYKSVPQGYRGWSCGTDANGDCLCGEPDSIDPSMAACPHAVLVPTAPQATPPPRVTVAMIEAAVVAEFKCYYPNGRTNGFAWVGTPRMVIKRMIEAALRETANAE